MIPTNHSSLAIPWGELSLRLGGEQKNFGFRNYLVMIINSSVTYVLFYCSNRNFKFEFHTNCQTGTKFHQIADHYFFSSSSCLPNHIVFSHFKRLINNLVSDIRLSHEKTNICVLKLSRVLCGFCFRFHFSKALLSSFYE